MTQPFSDIDPEKVAQAGGRITADATTIGSADKQASDSLNRVVDALQGLT